MKPIEIEIIPVSEGLISVSVNYNLPDSGPMIRRWQVDRATLDEIYRDVQEIASRWLAGERTGGAAAGTGGKGGGKAPRNTAGAGGAHGDSQGGSTAGPGAGMAARRAGGSGAAHAGGDTRGALEKAGRAFFEVLFRGQCDRMRHRAQGDGGIYFLFKVDRSLAYLPFEILHDGRIFLSRHFSFGRLIYSTGDESQAPTSGIEGRRALILGDPYEDPVIRDDVEREVDALRDLFRKSREYTPTICMGREVSESTVLSLLPETSILHFTGHGGADPAGRAGLLLYGDKVLTAEAFAGVRRPPAVAFFNTCSTASHAAWKSALGIMETLVARGTRVCIAPIWDVTSKAATSIALAFYSHLLGGGTFGEALRMARIQAASEGGPHDPSWAAYTLYGDPIAMLSTERGSISGHARGKTALRLVLALLLAVVLVLSPSSLVRDRIDIPAPVSVGYVIVESEPGDARILIDGEEAGLTPSAIEVSVGIHQIAVVKPGYRRWEASVDIKQAPETIVRAVLQEIEK